jgi:hypothetical protein
MIAARDSLMRVLGLILALPLVPAAAASPPLTREVVVSEIAWIGTSVSSTDEWLELYNNTSNPISLASWTLRATDGTPSITLQGSIPPLTPRRNA